MEETKRLTNRTGFFNKTGVFAPTEALTGTFYSNASTKTGALSMWQKDGKFDTVKVMDTNLQRKFLVDYYFEDHEVEDFVNDPRLLALAKIKFMNQEDTERATWEKKTQVKEMIGYLLN